MKIIIIICILWEIQYYCFQNNDKLKLLLSMYCEKYNIIVFRIMIFWRILLLSVYWEEYNIIVFRIMINWRLLLLSVYWEIYIQYYCFQNNDKLKNIIIICILREIQYYCFQNNDKLKSIIIICILWEIQIYCFQNNDKLKNIIIVCILREIQYYCFRILINWNYYYLYIERNTILLFSE